MRKAILLSLGLGVTLVAAVFVGAAAASTGAPVFYDARYPAPASNIPGEYEAGEGVVVEPGSDGTVDEADAEGEPIPTPPGSETDTAPGDAPPTAKPPAQAPGIPTPTPTPTPGAEEPGNGVPGDDDLGHDPDGDGHDGDGPTDGPTSSAPPPPNSGGDDIGRDTTEPSAAEQQAWLAFQQIVRDCMAGAGQEYLYWEWWNPGSDSSNRFPAMPADLTHNEVQAWELALYGTSPLGDAYRWQDAGCWGYAAHVSGNTH